MSDLTNLFSEDFGLIKEEIKDNVAVIVNRNSGTGWNPGKSRILRRYFGDGIFYTSSKREGIEVAEEESRKGKNIIIVGGDGTIISGLKGVKKSGMKDKVMVAHITNNSGNAIGTVLGLPKKMELDCMIASYGIRHGITARFDMIEVNGVEEDRTFFVGSGLDAEVAYRRIGWKSRLRSAMSFLEGPYHSLDASHPALFQGEGKGLMNKFMGFASYGLAFIDSLLTSKVRRKDIILMDGVDYKGEAFDRMVLPTIYDERNRKVRIETFTTVPKFGYGLDICPAASNDGYIYAVVLGMDIPEGLIHIPKLYRGKVDARSGYFVYKAKEVKVVSRERKGGFRLQDGGDPLEDECLEYRLRILPKEQSLVVHPEVKDEMERVA